MERKVAISTTAPTSPSNGDGWIHTTTRVEKVWDGSVWQTILPGLTTDKIWVGNGTNKPIEVVKPSGGASFAVSGATALDAQASPNSWTELNLSGIVGANSALVILAISAVGDMNATAVRRKGDTDEYYNTSVEASAYGTSLGHHDSDAVLTLMCVTDTEGIIEWITETSSTATIKVLAYIK